MGTYPPIVKSRKLQICNNFAEWKAYKADFTHENMSFLLKRLGT